MQSILDARDIVYNAGFMDFDWGDDVGGNSRDSDVILNCFADFLWNHKDDYYRVCDRDDCNGIPDQIFCMFVSMVLEDDPNDYDLKELSNYEQDDPQLGRSGIFESRLEWLRGQWMQIHDHVDYPNEVFTKFKFDECGDGDLDWIEYVECAPYCKLSDYEDVVHEVDVI